MKKTSALLLAAILCLALLAGCGANANQSASAPAPAAGSTGAPAASSGDTYRELTVGSTDSFCVGHFDVSAKLNDSYNCYSAFLAYDPMLYMDPATKQYRSDIFTEWYWDEELPGVVLTLRDDIYYSDGDQMLAEDVLYTFQRQSAVMRQAEQFATMLINEATISEDGLTLSVPFASDYGAWRCYLGGNTGVMNKSWVEAHGGDDCDFNDAAMVCGSGPYKVTEYVIDSYVVYEKRADWWMAGEAEAGVAEFDKITLKYYSDSTTMMVDYETGALDVAIGITKDDYDRVSADAALGTVELMSANNVAAINFDVDNTPALADVNLRRAICHGTNAAVLTQLAWGSLATPATSSISVYTPGYVDGNAYEYDPELAKQLVADNALAGTTLTWIATPGPTATIAEAFQSMMSEIGINIKIETFDMATAVVEWQTPGATAFQLDGASFGNTANEPNNQYQMIGARMFPCTYKSDPKLQEALSLGKYSIDESTRYGYYEQVQQIIHDEYYMIPIAEWNSALCYNSRVSSCTPTETSLANLRYIGAA